MNYKDIYYSTIVDYYKNPRNKGEIQNPDFSSDLLNPSCGDKVIICGNIVDRNIVECKFYAQGCVISCAAASMVAEYVEGKCVDSIINFSMEMAIAFIGMPIGPNRLRCALLVWEAIQSGLQEWQKKQI